VAVRGEVAGTGDVRPVARIDGGWTVCRPGKGWLYPAALEHLAVSLASQSDSNAIAAFVEDSDIAYAAAVTPDGVVSRLLFGEVEMAQELEEGIEALGLIQNDGRSAPEALEMWSQMNGHPFAASEVRKLLSSEWVFAEDAIDGLFKGVGIPLPWDKL
jgi:hypothetical protein